MWKISCDIPSLGVVGLEDDSSRDHHRPRCFRKTQTRKQDATGFKHGTDTRGLWPSQDQVIQVTVPTHQWEARMTVDKGLAITHVSPRGLPPGGK